MGDKMRDKTNEPVKELKGLTEQELESFSKGTFIIKIAKKLHLL